MTESQFQAQVVELARLRGWLVHHTRPALNRSGRWSTPITGDPGFPDLILARRGRVIIAELKSEQGRVSTAQRRWLTELELDTVTELGAEQTVEVFVWRPHHFDEIQDILR